MKNAETEYSCRLLENALNAMEDMVRVLSPERQVLFYNASYGRRFGDQQGKHCYEMFEQPGCCEDCISQRAWERGVPCEKRMNRNGRCYWVNASPVFGDESEPVGSIEVFRDITELLARERRLVEQNRRFARDAELAARLQRELFVSELPPEIGVEVFTKYLPASDLGGDLFGCALVEDKVVFYIADVQGHGVAAAMIALLVANNLRETMARGCWEPAQILTDARLFLNGVTKDPVAYVTAFVGTVDNKAHTLLWASAGHSVPMLLRRGDRVETLEAPSFPLCNWREEIGYVSHQTAFLPGDALLAYSDGLTDLRSGSLNQAAVEELLRKEQGQALLETLAAGVQGERRDDVCLLLLQSKQ